MAQDNKYGKIEIPGVPDDMPVFVILAKDKAAVPAIEEYGLIAFEIGAKQDFLDGVSGRAAQFQLWQNENTDSVKVPD